MFQEKLIDDVSLIRKVLSGDVECYSTILVRYSPKIRAYCRYMLGNLSDADDAAQEVFLSAFRNLLSFSSKSKFSTWLYSIANNHCVDRLRKRRLENSYLENFSIELPSTVTSSNAVEDYSVLRFLLSSLSPEQRSAILLKEVEGFSYDEISKMLKCSIDSVKAHLKRARKKLVSIYEDSNSFQNEGKMYEAK